MKRLKVLSGMIVLSLFNTAFAKDLTCPPLSFIRSNIVFERAIQVGDADKNGWGVTSKIFDYNEGSWSGILLVSLPYADDDPGLAVKEGQYFFNNSVLKQPTAQTAQGEHMVCNYTPGGAKYQFFIETPADYGLAKRLMG